MSALGRTSETPTPGAATFDRFAGSLAANYERYFVPAIAAPLAGDLLELAAIGAGERVLDVACGTGVLARLAAVQVGPAGAVAGLDVNPGMLAVARSVAPSIDWHESAAESTPFADGAFDVVVCQLGLQFFTDRSAALREMRRALVPGGRLLASVPGPPPRVFAILEHALRERVGAEAAGFVAAVFSLADPGEIRTQIDEAGFEDAAVSSRTRSLRLPAPADFLWQYVLSTPLAGAVAALDERRRFELEREVVARWERFTVDGALGLDLDVVVATAVT